jgi:hypothetical protein
MSRENSDGASAWLSSLGGFDAGAGIRMKIGYCLAGCRGIEDQQLLWWRWERFRFVRVASQTKKPPRRAVQGITM